MEPSSTAARRARVLWIGGRRGEILLLGPLFARLRTDRSWWLTTGEDGTAAIQALDALALRPDETAPLCHPADQPGVRLTLMMDRIEAFMRQRKGTRLIFCGYGPAAAAAALCCHARATPGLWLRPADPAALLPRLRWEAGLDRVAQACAPVVRTLELPPAPDWRALVPPAPAPPEAESPGLRPGAPRLVWATLRREWGLFGNTAVQLMRALADQAAARPDADFVVLSNLNAMYEKPLAMLRQQAPNLLHAPPLPPALYMDLLAGSSAVLTDSPLVAADALALGRPLAALGESPAAPPLPPPNVHPLLAADILDGTWRDWLAQALGAPSSAPPAPADPAAWLAQLTRAVSDWLAQE